MSLTRLAVNRPVTTLMVCLMVLLLGWMSLRRLAIDLMPDITYPTISVTTIYEGAGPDEIETLITRPVEQAAASVHGVEQIVSSSMEGSSTVRIRFAWGTDIDAAIGDVRAKIERIRSSLPEQIETPTIRRYDVSDFPIIYLGLTTKLDTVEATELVENSIAPQLENLDGVASIRIRGGLRREIQIDIDRDKIESLNMSVAEVVAAIRRASVNQPAGDFREGPYNLLVRSRGEFNSIQQISDTVVRNRNGTVVKVSDIATVVDGQERQTERTRVNGKPGLLLYVFKQSGANTVEVSDRVHRRVAEINETLRQGQLRVRIDKADFIRQSIDNVFSSILYGMLLAAVVLILFLRSFLSTLVIAICMPLSVLATFTLIDLNGFTLNMVSFGGLALGIGLLVDNSIVVLESIFRKREEGLDPKSAAIEGTAEVSSAIIASTATTLIVFLPLLFIAGTTGVILYQLAWVVSASLVCSLLASLTMTPMMTAYFIRADVSTRSQKSSRIHWATMLHKLNHRFFGLVENAYHRTLTLVMKYRTTFTLAMLAGFCISVGLSPLIGTEFLPKTDEGDLRITGVMAPGIQLNQLDGQAQIIERAILKNVPETNTTAVAIGDGADDADDWNECWFRLHLKPRSRRTRNAEEIRKALSEQIGSVPGMKVRVQVSSEQMISRMLRSRRGGGDIEVEILGHDRATAERLAQEVSRRMKSIHGLVNVEIGNRDRRPELAAHINRSKASQLGVSVSNITQTLETTIRGTDTTVFREDGNEYNVLVRLQEADRDRVDDVEQVGVPTNLGKIIPLKNVVNFQREKSPVTIQRLNQRRVLEVSADLEDRDLGSTVSDLQKELNAIRLPQGFSLNIAGDWEEQQKSFQDLRLGFILAVVLMYMVMASQFESLKDPLLILVTIPLGAIGVILVLVFTDTTLNVQSFIGMVMLAGIVVNNAIVLIDYINQLRKSHPQLPLNEIITRAAVRRFRPILMTTLTTILAMLPIALGWGEGGEMQAPMARVVIGGLLSGTLITLIAIPLLAYATMKPVAALQTEADSE
ncbi:MAG: efflux RND transporter permease subunit [Planctomycetaceae bacterium]